MSSTNGRARDAKSDLMLEIKGLKTQFYTEDGVIKAVDGVDLYVKRGETLGLVGESGCGKSTAGRTILQLEEPTAGTVQFADTEGKIIFDGADLLKLPEKEMTKIRGNRISMIFQQPTTCLNPVFKIGDQISEVLNIHQSLGKEAGQKRAIELLRMVGIPKPERRIDEYSFQLSGGLRQRVMIAMALACSPKVLIADEPTTALDVTTQAQILDLMRRLQDESGLSIILITHDMGVIAEMADDVVVMYLGRVVEQGPVDTIFHAPKHPYTRSLLRSIPTVLAKPRTKLATISGSIPHPYARPTGCPFHPRCTDFMAGKCDVQTPEIVDQGGNQRVSCFLYE